MKKIIVILFLASAVVTTSQAMKENILNCSHGSTSNSLIEYGVSTNSFSLNHLKLMPDITSPKIHELVKKYLNTHNGYTFVDTKVRPFMSTRDGHIFAQNCRWTEAGRNLLQELEQIANFFQRFEEEQRQIREEQNRKNEEIARLIQIKENGPAYIKKEIFPFLTIEEKLNFIKKFLTIDGSFEVLKKIVPALELDLVANEVLNGNNYDHNQDAMDTTDE